MLLGESGGFSLRWVESSERAALWELVKDGYAGPGGDSNGDFIACEFADDAGRIVYVEHRC